MKQCYTQNPTNVLPLMSKPLNRWLAYSLSLMIVFLSLIMSAKGQNRALSLSSALSNEIVIPDNASLQLTNSLTLEGWVKLTDFSGEPCLVTKGDDNGYILWVGGDGRPACRIGGGTTTIVSPVASALVLNTWYHIAVTYDGTIRRMYINGVQIATVTNSSNANTSTFPVRLGRWQSPTSRLLNGELDEIRIWNVARTCEQINSVKDRELIGNETGLVAYYNFNQGTAGGLNTGVTTLTDLATTIGGSNDGTLSANFTLNGSTSNWITSTNGVSGTTPVAQPEINVQGNSVSIVDGATPASLTNHTSFGNVGSSISLVRTYTIQNTGAGTLTISSIVPSGTDAAKFVVSGAPSSVAAGTSATFNVTYTPGAAGTHNATITINNTDCDESVYDFAIQGTGVMTQEINLKGNGVDITKGDLIPTTADHTDFVATGINTPFVRTFTIQNTGGATLNITSINNSNTADFTVGTFPATIAAGGSATFTVTLNSATVGTKTATITINNNDADEGSYDFAITGKVIAATPSTTRGNMMSFNGASSQYVNVPNGGGLNNLQSGTIEMWVKWTGTQDADVASGFGPITSRQNNAVFSNQIIALNNANPASANITWRPYTNIDVSITSSVLAGNDVWNHIAIVYASGSHTMYVNGVSVGTNNATGTIADNAAIPLSIGAWIGDGVGYSTSTIDEVRIWNTARTQAQIRENMHLTLSGAESNLLAYYQFNETSGVAIDAVAGNNGTLNGGASRTVSTVSVGGGVSKTVNVTSVTAGSEINLTTTGMEIDFKNTPTASANPNGDIVISQITSETPHANTNASSNTTSCYWVVRNFGVNAGLVFDNIKFQIPNHNTISSADETASANLKLYHRGTNSGGTWTEIGTANSASNTTKQINFTNPTNTSFSEFIIGSGSSPLPITLLSFEGKRTDESNVLLQWKTATELNNKGFEIESSENNTSFTKIAFVDGAGNSTNTKNYQRAIENSDDTYYRLKQIDFDGRFSYSNVIFVKGSENKVNIYPNPSNDNINIKTSKEGFVYEISTLQGSSLIKNNATSNVANVNIKSLPKGVYFVHIIQNNNRVVKKIVVE